MRAPTLRRVRDGIKVRHREGNIDHNAVSQAWWDHVQTALDPVEGDEALRYARLGQIVSLDFSDGAAHAVVQGTSGKPYKTEIAIGAFGDHDWERVVSAMATEAIHLVKLLAGEISPQTTEMFAQLDLEIMPTSGEPTTSCSCPRGPGCRHIGAVGLVVADRLAMQATSVLAIRGLPLERLVERVRQTREIRARGAVSAHADPVIPESLEAAAPLEECVDEFWRTNPALAELAMMKPVQHANHALLRRLGPSPLEGRFPLMGLLASVYDVVGETVERESAPGPGEA